MIERPRILVFYSMLFTLIALSFPIQIMLLYGNYPTEVLAIATKLSFLNMLVLLLAGANATLILRASPWARWTLPALFLSVIVNNVVVGYVGSDYSLVTTSLSSAGFFIVLLPLYQKQLRELFLHPEKRWWLQPRRVKAAVTVVVTPNNGRPFDAKTFDLSEGGTYIPLEAIKQHTDSNQEPSWQKEQKITVSLRLGTFKHINCRAEIVRVNQETNGKYPAGFGLRFEELNKESRLSLKNYISRKQSQRAYSEANV